MSIWSISAHRGQTSSSGGSSSAACTAAADGCASHSSSLLLSIPAAELHEVIGNQQRLERGTFTLLVVAAPSAAAQRAVAALPAPPAQLPAKQSLYPQLYQEAGNSNHGSEIKECGSSRIMAAVGGHTWELQPSGQTLKAGDLTFVFNVPGQDAFYTVVLSSDTSEEALGMLEAILECASIYRESQALLGDAEVAAGEAELADQVQYRYRSSLAQGVHRASRMLASGVLASATYASGGISRGAAYLTPAEPTAKPVAVSPFIKNRFRQTEGLARTSASVMNGAVSGLAWAGAKVAGGVLWMSGANKPLKPGQEASMLRELSRAAIIGFAEVWEAMEAAGRLVLLSARDHTTSMVRQRYGADAAEVSRHSMTAAGHGADAWLVARKIGVKSVAKAAAKKTAKGVIKGWAGVGPSAGSSGVQARSVGCLAHAAAGA